MELAQTFIGHAARELREPVVDRGKNAHHGGTIDHIVEVTNHEIGIADMDIDGHGGKHDAGNSGKYEVNQAAQAEQHRGSELELASPDGPQPGEHLHPRGHSDQHRGKHEKVTHPHGHTTGKHVVNPDNQTESNNNKRSQANIHITKEWLARINRKQLREDAKNWQDDHIHRRMGIEPEKVLIENRIATAFRTVKGGAYGEVEEEHHRSTGQGGQANQLQGLGRQRCPAKHGHAEQAHARRAHAQDCGHEVDRSHNRRNPR